MSERTLRIGIDIDDVLIKSVDRAVEMYNEAFGTAITRDTWYDFSDLEVWGDDDLRVLVNRVVGLFSSDAFASVQPLEGANDVLNHLKREGHELFAVTGRSESIRKQTLFVLDKCYPDLFENDTVFFVDHYSHDGEKASKADVSAELQLTHFVDDQIEHVNSLSRAGIKTVLFSQDYKWNQTGADDNVIRLNDWQSVGVFFDDEAARKS